MNRAWFLTLGLGVVLSSCFSGEFDEQVSVSNSSGSSSSSASGDGGSGGQGAQGGAGTAGAGGDASSSASASSSTAASAGGGGSSASSTGASGGGGAGSTANSSSSTGSGGDGGSGGGSGGMGGCALDEKACPDCVKLNDPAYGCAAASCDACQIIHATAICSVGGCDIGVCDSGFVNCNADLTDGCEVDTLTDPKNCGACSSICVSPHATPNCMKGDCGIAQCNQDFEDCNADVVDGCEAYLQSDPATCGDCVTMCTAFQTCKQGKCVQNPCGVGKADCNNDPKDGCEITLGTKLNCAFCGDVCNFANAKTTACDQGSCLLVNCLTNFANCDQVEANGCETDLLSSTPNCGQCNKVCMSGPKSTPVCTAGVCDLVCAGGFADCNAILADGCEVNLNIDAKHCGTCQTVCAIANGTPNCVDGTCAVGSCSVGFADCDGDPKNGCEVNLKTDLTHCGTCQTACSVMNGMPTCVNGTCSVLGCNANFADCNTKYVDGCEISLKTDPAHCGTCQTVCSVMNGTPGCTNGACSVAGCDVNFADCDAQVANGCEVNLKTDVNNCNACDKVCAFWPNSSPACAAGMCGISCSAGFADCDKALGNGCEISLKTDPAHCGTCQTVCSVMNGTPGCTNGACSVASCTLNFENCNGLVPDGCEISLKTDPAHCGTCQTVCSVMNGTPGCTNGACSVAGCTLNFENCNGLVGDGCEISLKTDPAHCGTCQTSCSVMNGIPGCTNGACSVASCNVNFGNCNAQYADGCETNTQTDNSHCGVCGNACGGGAVCQLGKCIPLGPCGPIPQTDWWMCYVFPNHNAVIPDSLVGFAGGKAADASGIQAAWSDPLKGADNKNCINPNTQDDTFLCPLGSLSSGMVVQMAAGLHANVNSGTSGGGFACDPTTCVGSAVLYFNGQVKGTMANTKPTGLLSLVPNFFPPGRLNLRFTVP